MRRSSIGKWRRLAGRLLPVLAGLSLSGCQAAHMALPRDLPSQSSGLAVEGRQLLAFRDSIRFGRYHVTDVHRGWTRRTGVSLPQGTTEFGSSEAKQRYEFSIKDEASERAGWDVRCAAGADWSQLETQGLFGGGFGIELSSDRQLVCTLNQDIGERPSRLVMAQSASAGQTVLQGSMTDGAMRIDISATHKLDKTALRVGTPTGYLFHIGGRPVGAVEVINKGTVWLNNSLTPETRAALAAASAVLLLYQDIKETS